MSKLLIIGAGGHGKVVKEIAEDINIFKQIEFIDDNSEKAIGKISDLEKLHREFDSAFVSIGNIELRKNLMDKLMKLGYNIPILIHPTAYVSKSSNLGIGTVVEPMAIINANSVVGKSCIISVGAIIDHNSIIGEYCQIDAGAVVYAGTAVNRETKVMAYNWQNE